MQGNARGDRLAEFSRRQAQAIAGNLHIDLVRGAVAVAQHHGYARHPLAADDADLDRLLAAIGNHRGDAAFNKVDLLDFPVADLQVPAQGQIDRFEMRLEQSRICARQARQKFVG